jgi:hypothetical protein
MSLSPSACSFFSCISPSKLAKRNYFLCKAKDRLSHFDFNLFCKILKEWESSPSLPSCFALWQKFVPVHGTSNSSSLRILSFNVRGLDLRWQEILLLISSFKFDALILLETGVFDTSFHENFFSNFKSFYQKGGNRNGGVLVLIRNDIAVSRVPCNLPNVCVIDIKGAEDFRLLGVYAPISKKWSWDDLSPFLTKKCIVFADFNVDVSVDGANADLLLQWAEDQLLVQAIPNSSTSLRSSRVIDYAFARGLYPDIQIYNGNTTSDHLPLISVIPFNIPHHKSLEKVFIGRYFLFSRNFLSPFGKKIGNFRRWIVLIMIIFVSYFFYHLVAQLFSRWTSTVRLYRWNLDRSFHTSELFHFAKLKRNVQC